MPLLGEWGGLQVFGRDSPMGYGNPRVVELLERERGTMEPDALDHAHQGLMAIFRADVPMTYLAPGVSMTVARRRVRGLGSPYRASLVRHAEELWLEQGVP
jgi:hypothetical protein